MKTMDIKEAAQHLHMGVRKLRDLIAQGDIPAARPGRKYVLLEEDLDAYLVRLQDANRQALAERSSTCQSTNAEKCGISTLPHQLANELDALLKQLTGKPQKNFTTS